ncbi:MAG: hypothetical protein H7Y06_07820, partial [Opitutaceae bacterium]|nr:hypothetical protein [Opitutaceae bacterium]
GADGVFAVGVFEELRGCYDHREKRLRAVERKKNDTDRMKRAARVFSVWILVTSAQGLREGDFYVESGKSGTIRNAGYFS